MTKEQKWNKAIAEACGWTNIRNASMSGTQGCCATDPNGITVCSIPDYCSDLNAMNDAEKFAILNSSSRFDKYFIELCKVSGTPQPFYATASWRAEAFLRTLNILPE